MAGNPGAAAAPAQGDAGALFKKLLWLTVFRLAWVTVLLGGAAAVSWRSDVGLRATAPLYPLVVGVYLVTTALGLALRRRWHLQAVAHVQVALDVALAAAVVAITGLAESVFVFMYSLAIVNGAIVLYRRGAVLAVALALPAHLLVQLLLQLPQAQVPWGLLVLHGGAFVVTAALAGYLAELLRRTGARLAERESDLATITALHESIVQSVTSGLVTLDLEGRVTFLNRAGESVLGIKNAQVRGTPGDPWLVGFARDAARSEFDYRTPDGQSVRLGYSKFRLMGREGQATGTAIIFQDLTALRSMEERVARSERLADLGRLAAGLAHELRNPLASLMGAQELLAQAPGLSEEDRRLMDIALRESTRLSGLVTQFLDFARPAALRQQGCDLAELAAETLDVFANDPAAARVDLSRDLARAPAQADPDQLRQVLWNLLLNAAQASGEAGAGRRGLVRVTTGPLGPGLVGLIVEDDGPGIDPADRERVFLPFYTTKPRGTGLGLASVHRIVEAHGGAVAIESSPAGGARLVVRLPRDGRDLERRAG